MRFGPCSDQLFQKLFAAVRVLLPILPAVAASSPLANGKPTGYMDYCMQVYPDQSPAQPTIVGAVVPEVIKSRAEHETCVLAPMFADIEAPDPAHKLRFEWLNSRGVIPHFDRNAIEIRAMDTQECPQADLALAALVVGLAHSLYLGEFASLENQQVLPTAGLSNILVDCNRDAEQAVIDDAQYLSVLGFPQKSGTTQALWQHLGETLHRCGAPHYELWQAHLQFTLQYGPLARRILRALGGERSHNASTLYTHAWLLGWGGGSCSYPELWVQVA